MSYMQYLRSLREDSDKTQQEVAEFLGTSQTMYARYEREENELPIRHLISLCNLYGVSASSVLEHAPEYRRGKRKELDGSPDPQKDDLTTGNNDDYQNSYKR